MDDVGKEAMIPEVETSLGSSSGMPGNKPPKFIREFSKQRSPEERKQLATEIRVKRKEYFDKKDEVIDKLENLENIEDKIVEAVELKAGFESLSSETRGMLKSFYNEQAEKWSQADYAKEDIQKQFTEEHLSSLGLEDYLALWRRFPSEFVSHVTRQGVRDHSGHMFHTTGLAEHHNNFVQLLQDGRLRSVFGNMMVTDQKEQALAQYLGLLGRNDRESALDEFENTFNISLGAMKAFDGTYADLMAVHFATEEVADAFYGAESGNEIFFVFPSALIASQYFLKGTVAGERPDQSATNDLWVWANEEKGVPINAGIVFIPADAEVDRKTGSKYAMDETGKAIVNTHYVDQVKRVVASPWYESLSKELLYGGVYDSADEVQQKLKPYKDRLRTDFGINDELLQDFILHLTRVSVYLQVANEIYLHQKVGAEEDAESIIVKALLESGLYLKKSDDTISSKDYWGNYFSSHPDLKPSKIVYYSGGDPTKAVYEFREEHNLINRRKEDELGFSERQIIEGEDKNLEVPYRGKERFRSIVLGVIDKIYPEAA